MKLARFLLLIGLLLPLSAFSQVIWEKTFGEVHARYAPMTIQDAHMDDEFEVVFERADDSGIIGLTVHRYRLNGELDFTYDVFEETLMNARFGAARRFELQTFLVALHDDPNLPDDPPTRWSLHRFSGALQHAVGTGSIPDDHQAFEITGLIPLPDGGAVICMGAELVLPDTTLNRASVLRVNPDGNLAWERTFDSDLSYSGPQSFERGTHGFENNVFLSGYQNRAQVVLNLNLDTGETIWERAVTDPLLSLRNPRVYDFYRHPSERVYFVGRSLDAGTYTQLGYLDQTDVHFTGIPFQDDFYGFLPYDATHPDRLALVSVDRPSADNLLVREFDPTTLEEANITTIPFSNNDGNYFLTSRYPTSPVLLFNSMSVVRFAYNKLRMYRPTDAAGEDWVETLPLNYDLTDDTALEAMMYDDTLRLFVGQCSHNLRAQASLYHVDTAGNFLGKVVGDPGYYQYSSFAPLFFDSFIGSRKSSNPHFRVDPDYSDQWSRYLEPLRWKFPPDVRVDTAGRYVTFTYLTDSLTFDYDGNLLASATELMDQFSIGGDHQSYAIRPGLFLQSGSPNIPTLAPTIRTHSTEEYLQFYRPPYPDSLNRVSGDFVFPLDEGFLYGANVGTSFAPQVLLYHLSDSLELLHAYPYSLFFLPHRKNEVVTTDMGLFFPLDSVTLTPEALLDTKPEGFGRYSQMIAGEELGIHYQIAHRYHNNCYDVVVTKLRLWSEPEILPPPPPPVLELRMGPNPGRGIVNYRLPDGLVSPVQLRVVGRDGAVVHRTTVNTSSMEAEEQTLELPRALATGIYWLHFLDAEGTAVSGKILVQR